MHTYTHKHMHTHTHTCTHTQNKYFLQSYLRTEGRNKQKPKIASQEQSQGSGLAALLKTCRGAYPSKSEWAHSVPTSRVQARPPTVNSHVETPLLFLLILTLQTVTPPRSHLYFVFIGVPCCRFIPLYAINFNK